MISQADHADHRSCSPPSIGALVSCRLKRILRFSVLMIAIVPGICVGFLGLGSLSASAQVDTSTTSVATTTTGVTPTGGTASATGEAIAGTFRNPDDANNPVAGVRVEITDSTGAVIGTATSAADGTYRLDLPGPGRYVAMLQLDSLPDNVKLTGASKTRLEFAVNPAQQKPLIFPFGKDTRSSVSIWDRLPSAIFFGLWLGLILAMMAIGLSLIYGTTQFTNFAHGSMVTLGAIIAWFLNQNLGLHLLIAAPISLLLCGALGGGLELGLWGPLRRKKSGAFGMMIVSFGLALFAYYVFQYIYGSRSQPFAQYSKQDPMFTIGNSNIAPKIVVTIVLSIVVLLGVGFFLRSARFGKAMRAVADNGPLAASSGINVDRVILLVWIGGSALAGLGGILYSIDQQVQFEQGDNILLLMFAGITLGGLGTSFGAAAGCLMLGMVIQVSSLWVPSSLKNVSALVILVAVLLFRPQGLFGRSERVG